MSFSSPRRELASYIGTGNILWTVVHAIVVHRVLSGSDFWILNIEEGRELRMAEHKVVQVAQAPCINGLGLVCTDIPFINHPLAT